MYIVLAFSLSCIMIIYEALHNPMTEESSPYTISIHKTKEGAERAINDSKDKVKSDHERLYADDPDDEPFSWDTFHWWGIKETKLLD